MGAGGKLSPVLKWAGGKTQLLDRIAASMPGEYGMYHEPFLGSAAVLLGIRPERASASDMNGQLVNLYIRIRDDASGVAAEIRKLDSVPCTPETYLAARDRYNRKIALRELDTECAALTVWINKHCFNGLYRVNAKGMFNVPYNNRKGGASVDEANLMAVSEYLKTAGVSISCRDFEAACGDVKPGDFVYFDSPYVPESATADFTGYAAGGFGLSDHERLAALFRRLDGIGAKVMLSNNDVPLVRELYGGYHIQAFDVKRMINSDAGRRTGREVLVTNYVPDAAEAAS